MSKGNRRVPVKAGFHYRKGKLYCENLSIADIAKRFGTPAYIYSSNSIHERILELKTALPENCSIHFAVKACPNIAVLKLFAKHGCGADIVSGGELFRAMLAGISPEKIVFSGVGKTENEIKEALFAGVGMINAESLDELHAIEKVAHSLRCRAPVSLRINPGIDAGTHPHISTGLKENKFGFSEEELKAFKKIHGSFKKIDFLGASCHIGSQISELRVLCEAWVKLAELSHALPFKVKTLDLGGGLGISYGDGKGFPSLSEFGEVIARGFKNAEYKLSVELGRSLIAPTAVLATRVTAVKNRKKNSYVIVDAGMNDLIRPALYGAEHLFIPVVNATAERKVSVAGPVCESSDVFCKSAPVPEIACGDLYIFADTGAYGMSMSSQYNSRPRAPEILVNGKNAKAIRKRENYGDLVEKEIF